jgi:molecular chaperone HscB
MRGEFEEDYFSLFGLPRSFDVDTQDLASRYRELQRQVHPDKFAHAPEQERRLSMQMTTRINEAFQTLKDPLTRGRYLLQLAGVETDEETDTRMDGAFLVEQMELRERLDEVDEQDDPSSALAAMYDEIDARLRTRVDGLCAALAEDAHSARMRARELVREMQFLRKLLKEVEDRQEAAF